MTESSTKRARIAYIVSAYRLPELLVRLVKRIDAPGTCTFIHVDAKSPDGVYRAMTEPLSGRPNVRFLPRHTCHWGDFGHVRATLKGLRVLIASNRPFDYVVLLTGQDYPLKTNEQIAATLGEAADKVFMRYMPIPNQHWTNGGAYRFENRYFRVAGRAYAFPGAPFGSTRLNRIWWRVALALGLYRTFPRGLTPYGGSSYWMLPADCARYVDEYTRDHPELVRFFHHVRIPDEIYFHTIVMNSRFRDRVDPDDLRYVDWDRGGDNPGVLTGADLPKLVASRALYARKFDPAVDPAVLDRIDDMLDASAPHSP